MHERQQDAMTYVRKYGHPDLFITATTNPSWAEIKDWSRSSGPSRYSARVLSLKFRSC